MGKKKTISIVDEEKLIEHASKPMPKATPEQARKQIARISNFGVHNG